MKLRNVSAYGDLDIPLIRAVVERGAEFDVSEEHARILLVQDVNYEPVDGEAKAIAKEIHGDPEEKPDPAPKAARRSDTAKEGDSK